MSNRLLAILVLTFAIVNLGKISKSANPTSTDVASLDARKNPMKKNSWISLSPHLKPGELIKFCYFALIGFQCSTLHQELFTIHNITRDAKNVAKRTRVMICCKINQRTLYTKSLFCIHKSLILAPMKNHLATA